MGISSVDGPRYSYGPTTQLGTAFAGNTAVGDPNTDAGPDVSYQGYAFLDPRWMFPKDQMQGYTGRAPIHMWSPHLLTVSTIPIAVSASNIAAAQGVTSGTAMTLATATVAGIAPNIPIIPFNAGGISNLAQGASPTNVLALDFGFAFGNCTAGNATIPVSSSADFTSGMPLVIGGVGNAAGTAPLLTNVVSTPTATTITVQTAPLATNATAPIGTGNVWGPSPTFATLATMTPNAAQPWIAGGPGLVYDHRQALTRGVQIVGVAGSAGGTFTIRGFDYYNVPMSATVPVAAGANTGWSLKAFKYILSVTPNFTDAGHNYTVGTSDMFGFNYRAGIWDFTEVTWNNLSMTSATGFTAGVGTNPATALTGDIRGTIQTSGNGPLGGGIGATASNGTIVSLALSGVRVLMMQIISPHNQLAANPNTTVSLFGVAQA